MKKNRRVNLYHRWDPRPRKRIKTTMYDLIRALNEEVTSNENVAVPLIVLDMMDRGILKFTGHSGVSK